MTTREAANRRSRRDAIAKAPRGPVALTFCICRTYSLRVEELGKRADPVSPPQAPAERPEAAEPGSVHVRKRDAILREIPAWYRPGVHLAIPTAIGIGLMAAAIGRLDALRPSEVFVVPLTLFFGLGFEWRAHKDVLHRRLPLLGTIYERHELKHHVVYTHDDMAMRSSREMWLILMPAYAIVLVALLVTPLAVAFRFAWSANAAALFLATSMAFFLAYEWLHLAYHLPPDHPVGRSAVIAFLREQHRRHHDPRLMKRWNFNVTVPVFDGLHGTLWSPERERQRDARRHAAVRPRPAERAG